jgi:hypothetical protein
MNIKLALVVLLSTSPALAATEIAAMGGLEATRAWSTIDDTGDADIGGAFGFGGMVRHGFGEGAYSLEYGLFRIPYALHAETDTGFVRTSQPYLQIPLIFRYHPKQTFSVGVGYYAARSVGYAKRTVRTEGSPDAIDRVSTPASSQFDHGVALVLGLKFPLASRLNLIGDMRYLFGLKNVGVEGIQEHYNHMELLAGLALEL